MRYLLVCLFLLFAACSNSDSLDISRDSSGDSALEPDTSAESNDSLPSNGEYLVDARDGQRYRMVTIGGYTWMAENLKYKTCDQKYYEPGIYFWKTAQKVCLPGWHLPSKQEVEVLFASVGGDSVAGRKLSARDTSHDGMFSGTDEYGFSVFI